MNPLPIQPAKIHCPLERRDTLTRPRLNSWLDQASAGRLGMIIAEAGFGKTTLLGDWARHTRRMTAWYRLEPDDADWLVFVRHLVASGRELQPDFAPATFAMLLALGGGGPTQKDLVLSIAREMAELGTRSERGLTLIIDDYHLVDGCDEIEPIVRALLDRTGPGFSVILASRSKPKLPVGRLRARGGVKTLGGQDLRFDVAETSSLFRDAYQHPLDQDLVADLCERTDGWPALLTLVNARLAERLDPRSLLEELRATEGDIYDFLAEELFANLSPALAWFLMRVSILTEVEPTTTGLVTDGSVENDIASISEAERLGLLSRPDDSSPHRFHPLVQEFLKSRLVEEVGPDAVRAMHQSVAARLPPRNWHGRAWHLLNAGDVAACQAVIDSAIEQITASGEFDTARQFLVPEAGDPQRPAALFLRSKIELVRGDFDSALRLARLAVDRSRGGSLAGLCLLNLAATLGTCGIADEAEAITTEALDCELSPVQRYVALGNLALLQASQEGDLRSIADSFRSLADEQERTGLRRYAGISRLNLAGVLLWVGDASGARREGARAQDLLGGRDTEAIERVSATAILAIADAQLGNLREGRERIGTASDAATSLSAAEVTLETARLELEFGSEERAGLALKQFRPDQQSRGHEGLFNLLAGELAFRVGDLESARGFTDKLEVDRCADAAGKLRAKILRARISLAQDRPDAASDAEEVGRIARAQNTPRGTYVAGLLGSFAMSARVDEAVLRGASDSAYCWSVLAEELAQRLHQLSPAAVEYVLVEARHRPERWRQALRRTIEANSPASSVAASFLSDMGTDEDAAWLRSRASTRKELRAPALVITQRLAEKVLIADLGPVQVLKGASPLRRPLRRKVLALLCYLASRPRMAANREEAIEALWPDLGPDAGGNSLHQAIYFMRRVFEPDFREGMSADYIRVDGDVVSLNADTVDSVSASCWRLLGEIRSGKSALIDELLSRYVGRYALTFAYDAWAEGYRETLHAAVLAAGEAALRQARRDLDFNYAIKVGHALLAIDPMADGIELELLRAYKQGGRRAAAAEQYAHYAAYMRKELGVEPPRWDDL